MLCKRRRWRRQLTLLQGFPSGLDRNARLAGYAYLTQAAAVSCEIIGFFDIIAGPDKMLPALFLIVA